VLRQATIERLAEGMKAGFLIAVPQAISSGWLKKTSSASACATPCFSFLRALPPARPHGDPGIARRT
jgi:hypothetical protein